MNRTINKRNKSGFKGITWHEFSQSWHAKIKKDYITYSLKYYKNPIDAAKAYDEAALELFGEFARTNKMMGLL